MWGALAPHINFRIFNQTKNLIVMYKLAKPLPSVELLKEKFEIDPTSPSGLRWKIIPIGGRGKKPGDLAGRKVYKGYWQVSIGGQYFYASRVIWKMVTGNDPKEVIDHIDGDNQHNNFNNYQDITQQQNLNTKPGEIINAA